MQPESVANISEYVRNFRWSMERLKVSISTMIFEVAQRGALTAGGAMKLGRGLSVTLAAPVSR
ncbi:hypothetical protein GCM10023259_103440 [Thermocatellispora tengchongensis]